VCLTLDKPTEAYALHASSHDEAASLDRILTGSHL
jgi:hypothetical protein